MKNKQENIEIRRERMSRRGFLGGSLAVLVGAGLSRGEMLFDSKSSLASDTLKIREFRTLGRTGFKVSDIGLGSGELNDPALLEAVLDAGINYIDTAEGYMRGGVEKTIGSVIKNRDRKSFFLSTKLTLGRNRTKESYIGRARRCLERLQTDTIDCLMIHMPSTVEDLKTEGFHEAIRELKAEGRVRFCGLSNHGSQWGDVPETMEKVHMSAAEDGRFDVALLVYNFIQREMGENILKAYKEKNVGTTIMKTNPVLNYLEMKERADEMKESGREVPERLETLISRLKTRADQAEAFKNEYNLTNYNEIRDAAIKFVLSHPYVSTACPTIKNYDDLEAYVALSGTKLKSAEKKILAAYEATFGEFYCRHACGKCESRCPYGVPVNTIMRYNHYFMGQGREKTAMVKYRQLEAGRAARCDNCSGYCEQSCPYGVPIQGLLMIAHKTLTLS
ncbi:MAG: aldo/keto reductase [Candidatus Aminicenantes bacterium]|jgi:predicted aldo/keto reductase-like oxidoreductase